MIYEISSVSNRDLVLLHHYRILRQKESDFLAPFQTGEGKSLIWFATNIPYLDGYRHGIKVGQIPKNTIPILNFQADSDNLDMLAELTGVEVNDDEEILYLHTSHKVSGSVTFYLYWYDLISKVDSILAWKLITEEKIKALQGRIEFLEEAGD